MVAKTFLWLSILALLVAYLMYQPSPVSDCGPEQSQAVSVGEEWVVEIDSSHCAERLESEARNEIQKALEQHKKLLGLRWNWGSARQSGQTGEVQSQQADTQDTTIIPLLKAIACLQKAGQASDHLQRLAWLEHAKQYARQARRILQQELDRVISDQSADQAPVN